MSSMQPNKRTIWMRLFAQGLPRLALRNQMPTGKCCAHLCASCPLSGVSPNIIRSKCQFQSWRAQSATAQMLQSISLHFLLYHKDHQKTDQWPMNDIGCLTIGCSSQWTHQPPPAALVPCAEPEWCPWWWSRPPGSSLAAPNRSGIQHSRGTGNDILVGRKWPAKTAGANIVYPKMWISLNNELEQLPRLKQIKANNEVSVCLYTVLVLRWWKQLEIHMFLQTSLARVTCQKSVSRHGERTFPPHQVGTRSRAHQIHSTAQGQRTQAMRLLQPAGPRSHGLFLAAAAMELNDQTWNFNGNWI